MTTCLSCSLAEMSVIFALFEIKIFSKKLTHLLSRTRQKTIVWPSKLGVNGPKRGCIPKAPLFTFFMAAVCFTFKEAISHKRASFLTNLFISSITSTVFLMGTEMIIISDFSANCSLERVVLTSETKTLNPNLTK